MKFQAKYFVIALAFIMLWAAYALQVDSRFYIFEGGSAQYIVMARSLAEHHRYYEYFSPAPRPHIKVPPLLALMISPIYALRGADILAMKILFLVFLALASIAGYLLFMKLFGNYKKALAVMVLSLLMPLNYSLMQKIAPEIPFLAFSYFSLYLLTRASENKISTASSIFAGVVLGLCVLLRTTALVMVLSFFIFAVLDLVVKKSRKHFTQYLIILAVSLGIFSGWAARNQVVKTGDQKGYFNFIFMESKPGSMELGMNDLGPPLWPGTGRVSVSGFLERAIPNAKFYLEYLSWQVTGKPNIFILLFFAMLGLVGFAGGFRKHLLVNVYGALYILQILFWPFSEPRFLSPLSGLIFFWVLAGVSLLASKFKTNTTRALAQALVFLLLAGAAAGFIRLDHEILKSSTRKTLPAYKISKHFTIVPLTRYRDSFTQLLVWTKNNTEPDAVIAAIDPNLVYLVAERKAILFPATHNHREFWDYLARNRVNYILVDEISLDIKGGISLMTESYLWPALLDCPYHLNLVESVPSNQSMIYSISYNPQ